jgi:hypothetical protein
MPPFLDDNIFDFFDRTNLLFSSVLKSPFHLPRKVLMRGPACGYRACQGRDNVLSLYGSEKASGLKRSKKVLEHVIILDKICEYFSI